MVCPDSIHPDLTAAKGPTIMVEPGKRDSRVNIKPNRQDEYERIRPQGGRGFRAFQSLGGQYRRHSGKRDGGTGDVFERRGRAGGANSLLEGAANGGGKAFRVRRLSGNPAQGFLNRFDPTCRAGNMRPSL